MSKKFQVFISSTYEDLKVERKAIEETIIRAGDIPVGMEAFPAADDEQFDFIKSVISTCDYYVLVVAGRYGSLANDGLSYTEKEFDFAVSKGIPVLFLLHGDRGNLPANKTEENPKGKKLLEGFIEKASTNRIRKTWNSIDGLKLAVREALDHAKATKPRPGWVRGDEAASPELLNDLGELKRENESLKEKLSKMSTIKLPEKLSGSQSLVLSVTYYKEMVGDLGFTYPEAYNRNVTVESDDLFAFDAPNMRGPLIHSKLKNRMAIYCMGGGESKIYKADSLTLDDQGFHQVIILWEAQGLIRTMRQKTSASKSADFSELTEYGEHAMLEYRLKQISR